MTHWRKITVVAALLGSALATSSALLPIVAASAAPPCQQVVSPAVEPGWRNFPSAGVSPDLRFVWFMQTSGGVEISRFRTVVVDRITNQTTVLPQGERLSANAKFTTRAVTNDAGVSGLRITSRETGATRFVPGFSDGTLSANGSLLFGGAKGALVSGVDQTKDNYYVVDIASGVPTLVSKNADGSPFDGYSYPLGDDLDVVQHTPVSGPSTVERRSTGMRFVLALGNGVRSSTNGRYVVVPDPADPIASALLLDTVTWQTVPVDPGTMGVSNDGNRVLTTTFVNGQAQQMLLNRATGIRVPVAISVLSADGTLGAYLAFDKPVRIGPVDTPAPPKLLIARTPVGSLLDDVVTTSLPDGSAIEIDGVGVFPVRNERGRNRVAIDIPFTTPIGNHSYSLKVPGKDCDVVADESFNVTNDDYLLRNMVLRRGAVNYQVRFEGISGRMLSIGPWPVADGTIYGDGKVTVPPNAPYGAYDVTALANRDDPDGARITYREAAVVRPVTGEFHALSNRIVDTRSGTGGRSAPVGPGETVRWRILGAGGMPLSGVASVSLNVTVTNPTATSYLTVFPSTADRPVASNLNFSAGQTVPNMVTVGVGADGSIAAYNESGTVDLIIDLVGWVASPTAATEGAAFIPVTPYRAFDSRRAEDGGRKLGPGQYLRIQIVNYDLHDIVRAVALNVTAANPTEASFISIIPDRHPVGNQHYFEEFTTSNLNVTPNSNVANMAIVAVGPDLVFGGGPVRDTSEILIFNAAGSTDIIVDVFGFFFTGIPIDHGLFTPADRPTRVLDTRNGLGGPVGKVAADGTITVDLSTQIPVGTSSVALNVTANEPVAGGYLSVWPATRQDPGTSNLNFDSGQTVPNQVMVRVGADRRVVIKSGAAASHVIVDLLGWFSDSPLRTGTALTTGSVERLEGIAEMAEYQGQPLDSASFA
jgi:hypothetical protein